MADNTTNQDASLNQGSSTGKTNVFMKGMIKDSSEIFVPEGVWTNAINAVNISHKGDEGVIGNEQSNLYCTTAPYTIIGILHKYKTEWIVFSTNNVSSEIGTFDEADCSYTTLVNDSCLNFNTKYMITGAVKYNADCTYSVYWADNNNPDRTMNLDPTRIPYICSLDLDPNACGAEICTNAIDCEQLRLHPLVEQPCITVSTSIGAGQLQNGSYQAVIAYSYNGIKLTDYSTPSQPQALWDHSGVGGSIDIKISNLDLNFEEYELVVISVINQQTIAKKIGNYNTMQSSVHLDLYLESLVTIPLSQIPLKSQIYEKSKKMFSLNGYLIRTSVTTQPYFNYQPFANAIRSEWVSAKYPADFYWKKGNTVGYMRDEVYSFFIRWVYKTGARSASFHIPGREATASDLVTLSNNNTDVVDPLQNKVWNVYDTSTSVGYEGGTTDDGGVILQKGRMAYWESTELYPNKQPEIWGDLCNKPIRHHKMPSNETTHIHSDGGNSIVVLGVQFSNIKHPIDNQGNPIASISGYEILRGSREGNRSIVAKGMFNNMLEFNIQGSTSKGLMQNYPYNDLRISGSNDAYLEGVAPRKDVFSFHSPETTIVRPYLGAGVYSKIYTEEIGDAKGSFMVPYRHPKEKVLGNWGFASAAIIATGIGIVSTMGKTTTAQSSTGHTTTPAGEFTLGTAATGYTMTRINTPFTPFINFDTGTSMTTEGGTSTAVSNLLATTVFAGANVTTASTAGTVSVIKTIVDLITMASQFVTFFYEALETVLDIWYKIIPFRDYVLQSNSHAFYNSFDKITNTNSLPSGVTNFSISRKLNLSKYTSSGLQDFNANFRINNLYRNKFVTVHLNKELQNPINQDSSKITAANGIGINNEYTTRTVAYYGALKLDYQNQYGQLQAVVQIPTDSCVRKTESVLNRTHFTGAIFGGDVYINRYTEKNMYAFFNTWAYDLPDGTPFNYNLYNNGPKPRYRADFRHFKASDFGVNFSGNISNLISFSDPDDLYEFDTIGSSGSINLSVKGKVMYLFNNGVRDFFTESELNMAFRDYGENEWEKFYDVYGNSFNDLNVMFRSDIITRPIYYRYDLSLSTSKLYNNFASWASILPSDYDPVLYDTCYQYFPYRGIYSLQQQDGLKRDNWRNFLPLNYYTFEGIVTNIKAVNSSGALILYEDFTPSQFVGVDTLKTEAGTKVTIGDGGLFANNIQSLANAEDVLDYGASISSRATLNTPYGTFYVSQKAGKIIQYGSQGLQEISKAGMKNWFLQNLPSELLKSFPNFTEYDNPVDGIAVQAVYDAQYELMYFTKKDYKPKSPCIGYTPELGFYDKCNCPNTCPSGFALNVETGLCEKIVDAPRCQTGFSYNPETGNCEAIVRTVASCQIDNE